MTWAAATFLVVAFLLSARLLRVPSQATAAVRSSRAAVLALRSPDLSDLQKERAMRSHTVHLLKVCFILSLSSAAALAAPLSIVWVLDRARVLQFDRVLQATLSWEFLLATALAGGAVFAIARSRRRRRETPE